MRSRPCCWRCSRCPRRCSADPDVAFIRSGDEADWITWDRPGRTRDSARRSRSRNSGAVRQDFRSWRRCRKRRSSRSRRWAKCESSRTDRALDLPSSDRGCFKAACETALTPFLHVGEEFAACGSLEPVGPAAAATSRRWSWKRDSPATRVGRSRSVGLRPAPRWSRTTPARSRNRGHRNPASHALHERATTLAALFVASRIAVRSGAAVATRSGPTAPARIRARSGDGYSGSSCSLTRFIQLPPHWGYDAKFQGEYIHYILDHQSLPLASDGFSMYHPPLYYGLSAAVVAATGPERGSVAEQAAMKFVPLLCGLGMVLLRIRADAPQLPRRPSARVLRGGVHGNPAGEPLHVGLRFE